MRLVVAVSGMCLAAAIAVAAFAIGLAPAMADVQDCSDCPKLIAIAPGWFDRGALTGDAAADPGEYPRQRVTIAKPFAIGRTSITVSEFSAFVAATGYAPAGGCYTLTLRGWMVDDAASWRAPGFWQTAEHPAVCVSWRDATAYVDWLSKRTGRRYRLPSEAEWELAARGGTATRNFWGDDDWETCRFANVNDITAKNKTAKIGVNCDDGFLFTAPVASFLPNPFGLYDMIGNNWQWLGDCWTGSYEGVPTDGSAAATARCEERVLRGGSWTDTPGPVRIGAREHRPPDARLSIIGFRVARDM